jgi:hypothetical protein
MSDMEFPSPVPRRVSKPRWLDPRLVFGIVLVLAAVLLGAKVVASARHTDKELAVTHDLAAGTTLRAADLETVQTQLPDGAQVYVRDLRQAVGRVLDRPLAKGELLPSAVLKAAPRRTTVSVPFTADAAPKLSRGQRVIIWVSTKTCPSLVLISDVTVQDVHAADAGSFAAGGAGQDVVLSVSPDLAQRVIGAMAMPESIMRAGVLTGGSDSAAAQLPALDSCGASPSP